MSLAIDFPQRNRMYVAEGCHDLPVHEYREGTDRVVISCWRLNLEELNYVNEHGVVFVKIIGGQPPMTVLAEALFTNDPQYQGADKLPGVDKWAPLYYPICCYMVEKWGAGCIKEDNGQAFTAQKLHRFVKVNAEPEQRTSVSIGALGEEASYTGPVDTLEDFKRIFTLLTK